MGDLVLHLPHPPRPWFGGRLSEDPAPREVIKDEMEKFGKTYGVRLCCHAVIVPTQNSKLETTDR